MEVINPYHPPKKRSWQPGKPHQNTPPFSAFSRAARGISQPCRPWRLCPRGCRGSCRWLRRPWRWLWSWPCTLVGRPWSKVALLVFWKMSWKLWESKKWCWVCLRYFYMDLSVSLGGIMIWVSLNMVDLTTQTTHKLHFVWWEGEGANRGFLFGVLVSMKPRLSWLMGIMIWCKSPCSCLVVKSSPVVIFPLLYTQREGDTHHASWCKGDDSGSQACVGFPLIHQLIINGCGQSNTENHNIQYKE